MQGPFATTSGGARWLVAAPCAFVAGNLLQLFQPALWPWSAYVACFSPLALCVWAAWFGIHRLRAWRVACIAAIVLAAFGMTGWRAVLFQQQALDPSLEGRDLMVTGIVAAMPQVDAQGLRLRFEVESARDANGPVALPPRLSLGWYFAPTDADDVFASGTAPATAGVVAGERWHLSTRLRAPHGNLNPFGFDYELWSWEQGIQATGSVRAGAGGEAPHRLGQTWRHPVEQARQSARDRLLAHLGAGRAAGWIAALVTGEQNAIGQADWDLFRATGVAHLMSISGLHITMFAWLAVAAVGFAWRLSTRLCLWLPAPQAALVGGFLLALAYALFSGWGVPAQRTVCMLGVVSLLRFSSRQWPWPIVWLSACVVVVGWDPWALLQPGFWLSFVAVGVLFASDPGRTSDTGLVVRLRGALREQGVITLALTPLVLLLFGQVSLVGLLANAVAIPGVTLLLTPLALLGVFWAPLWDLAARVVDLLAWVLGALAALPFAQVTLPIAPLGLGVVAVAGGVLLVLRLPASLRLAGVPLLLPVFLWQAPRPAAGAFEVLAADVGQGSAVLVRTAHHALLYDTGPAFVTGEDAGRRTLVPLLRALDERLDTLIVSHRDLDHAGGAAAVLATQPEAALRSSIEPGHPLWALRPGRRCEAGQRWEWDGVVFELLHPATGDYAARSKSNALSCVLRVRALPAAAGGRGASALLAGDIEAPTEQMLVDSGADLRADVLLVPHHGSKTSSSAAFLDAVRPRIAVIQAGYRNRFGHPAAAPLSRLKAREVAVYDTVRCGAITWRSDEPERTGCLRRDQPRYWQHQIP